MKVPFEGCNFESYPKGTVTQYFGENPSLYAATCASPGNCLRGHNGIDLVAPWGTPIVCVMAGKVVEVKDLATGYGKHVRVLSQDAPGSLIEWTYGHLSRIDVQLGEMLPEGKQLGLMGNTGFVVSGATPFWKYNPYAGTHLHLNARPLKEYVQGSWDISYSTGDKALMVNYSNGYFGAVDPLLYFKKYESFGDPFDQTIEEATLTKRLTIISVLNNIRRLFPNAFK